MAREIVAWCDIDLASDERVPAATYPVDVGGGQRLLDLCEAHRKELLAPLVEALQLYGAKPDGPARAPRAAASAAANSLDALLTRADSGERAGKRPSGQREYQCPFCPLDYSSSGAFTKHAAKNHGFAAGSTFSEIMGRRCPVCGMGGLQLLSQHAMRMHHVANGTQLFVQALAEGDPHGIVAEVVATAQDVR